MVIFNPFYIKNESCILHNESRKNTHKHTKKKKSLNEIWYEPSVERESLRVLRASYRRYSVRPGGAAKLAGPGTARPARRQRRVGKKIPSPPLPRNSSALPSASSRSCPCRRTSLSLSLVSSSSWCARARFASVCFWRRKILDFEKKKRCFATAPSPENIIIFRSLRILIGSSPRLACCAGAAILLPGGRIIGRVVVGGFPGEVPRPSDPSPPHHHHRRRQPSGCDGESFSTIAQLDTVFLGYDFFS